MTAVNRADICDTKVVRHKYEILRANALGSINRAPEFTLFLRNGMRAWLRELSARGCGRHKMHQERSPVFTEGEMPETGICSILVDAILNVTRADTY